MGSEGLDKAFRQPSSPSLQNHVNPPTKPSPCSANQLPRSSRGPRFHFQLRWFRSFGRFCRVAEENLIEIGQCGSGTLFTIFDLPLLFAGIGPFEGNRVTVIIVATRSTLIAVLGDNILIVPSICRCPGIGSNSCILKSAKCERVG
jgi:hypothetical protein